MSTGFQLATTWGQPDEKHWTTGVDLRYLKQELNEIATGQLGFNFFQNANSPIPRSDSLDPGIFVERAVPINERLNIKAGTRMDFVSTAVIDDPQKLQTLGLQNPQYSLADTLGTDQFDQSFSLWGAHITGEYKLKPCCMLTGSVGYAERPPTLTELYVAESFLFLLQNGLNTATGDPLLDPEQALQFDLGLAYTGELCRFGVNGFYSHIHDYITFENLESDPLPPFGHRDQTNLKYVNTNLASLAGVETYAECEATCWLTPFATLKFVEGRDHTRNGNFATRQVSSGNPSERVSGAARGSFSGIPGADKEPLPNILPLETQLGFRFHPAGAEPTWSVELSARVVDNQDRIATSLLESPTSGFTIYNIRGYWQARKQLLLVAGIENFTDKNYREHLDFRSPSGYQLFQPGIIFYSGMEYKY